MIKGYVIKLNNEYYCGINDKVGFNRYKAVMTNDLSKAKIYPQEINAMDVLWNTKAYELREAKIQAVKNEFNPGK